MEGFPYLYCFIYTVTKQVARQTAETAQHTDGGYYFIALCVQSRDSGAEKGPTSFMAGAAETAHCKWAETHKYHSHTALSHLHGVKKEGSVLLGA